MSSAKTARRVGCLEAESGSLWFIACDSQVAAGWNGYQDRTDDDFHRAIAALAKGVGDIAIGSGSGVVVEVGPVGWSHVWRVDDAVVLVSCEYRQPVGDVDATTHEQALTQRIGMLPVVSSRQVGSFNVKSSMMLMLPYVDDTTSSSDGGTTPTDHIVLEDSAGRYVVWEDTLDHTDDIGVFDRRVRIVDTGS